MEKPWLADLNSSKCHSSYLINPYRSCKLCSALIISISNTSWMESDLFTNALLTVFLKEAQQMWLLVALLVLWLVIWSHFNPCIWQCTRYLAQCFYVFEGDLCKLTSPMFITHCEQAGLVCEFRQQAAALHHNSLRDHNNARHNPDDNNTLASPLGCTLEHQWVADSIPSVLGNTTQC